MADDDWDLYAVVRSCNSATNTATTTSNPIHHGGSSEEPSWMWDRVMKREELETNVGFPNLESRAEAFQGLEEFYLPFFPNPTIDNTTTTTTTTTTNTSSYAAAGTIIPNSSTSFISDFGGGSSSSGQHQLQQQQNNFVPANTNTAITPHFNPGFTPVSGFGRFHEHQQLKQLETPDHPQELIAADPRRKAAVPSVGPLMPTMQIPPQLIRPRKRKNQVKKVVCHLTADNLSSDLWAWRKYGQKPIKGSPHPRNYYRCSSSKGCSARKQVERSTEDSGMFVVTYAGEHTHPRPTHRNSLAGSTRNKPAATTPKAKDSGSPASSAQVLAAQGEDDEQTGNNNSIDGDKASEEADDEEIEEDEDDEEFLVPNMGVSEDIFLGMKQLGRTASGGSTLGSLAVGTSGDGFSTKSSNLGSSWGTNCSSSAGATVGGGC